MADLSGYLSTQGPDEVHVQQIGQRELKRVPRLKKLSEEAKKSEAELFRKHGIKAHL